MMTINDIYLGNVTTWIAQKGACATGDIFLGGARVGSFRDDETTDGIEFESADGCDVKELDAIVRAVNENRSFPDRDGNTVQYSLRELILEWMTLYEISADAEQIPDEYGVAVVLLPGGTFAFVLPGDMPENESQLFHIIYEDLFPDDMKKLYSEDIWDASRRYIFKHPGDVKSLKVGEEIPLCMVSGKAEPEG